MKNEHAVALGSIKSKKKAKASRENGKLGGRPKKPMEIPLTHGKVALVDKEDYAELILNKWHANKKIGGKTFYAQRTSKREFGKSYNIYMHREIMKPTDDMYVDHIDHNGLNNTRANLRICTMSQNKVNTGKTKSNTSGFKGVHLNKKQKKWVTQIRILGKMKHLGSFDTPEDAYKVYCEACIKYHGEFANIGN